MKRIIAALLGAFLFVGIMPPSIANAHISTCTISAYNPDKVPGARALRAKGRWFCEAGSHHEYVSNKIEIQYWSERVFWGDGWATLARNRNESSQLIGQIYAGAPCANGNRKYRTKYTLYMVGAHGVREKVKYSYGTSIYC